MLSQSPQVTFVHLAEVITKLLEVKLPLACQDSGPTPMLYGMAFPAKQDEPIEALNMILIIVTPMIMRYAI